MAATVAVVVQKGNGKKITCSFSQCFYFFFLQSVSFPPPHWILSALATTRGLTSASAHCTSLSSLAATARGEAQ